MTCLPINNCCETEFGYALSGEITYYNVFASQVCPAEYSGGPFVCPARTFSSTISQADADNKAAEYLANLVATECVCNTPVVTSPTLTCVVGSAFSYQIEATNSPTSFGATGLPDGLSINTSTGVISGTLPSSLGTVNIDLTATNSCGTGNGTLQLDIYNGIGLGDQGYDATFADKITVCVDDGESQIIQPGDSFDISPVAHKFYFRFDAKAGTFNNINFGFHYLYNFAQALPVLQAGSQAHYFANVSRTGAAGNLSGESPFFGTTTIDPSLYADSPVDVSTDLSGLSNLASGHFAWGTGTLGPIQIVEAYFEAVLIF